MSVGWKEKPIFSLHELGVGEKLERTRPVLKSREDEGRNLSQDTEYINGNYRIGGGTLY